MPRSSSPVRMILVLPVAAIVTLGLFVAMSGIIHSDASIGQQHIVELRQFNKPEPAPPPIDQSAMQRPDPTVVPPPEPRPVPGRKEDGIQLPPEPLPDPVNPNPDEFIGGMPAPLVTLQPVYPADCQGRGREGFATVIFDITAAGDVVNARVVDSSHRCFERTALNTIRNWKYQPALGQSGIIATGIRKTFRFQLTE